MGEDLLLMFLAMLSLGCVLLLWHLMADDFQNRK
jgi:hypothetical protein